MYFIYKLLILFQKEENTILHVACTNHRDSLIKYLLNNGFIDEINSKNKVKTTNISKYI